MIFFEGNEVTQLNKSVLAQDLSGRAVWITINDRNLLAPFKALNPDAEQFWTKTNGRLFLHCVLLEKTDFHENRYEAVLLEHGHQIKTWGSASISDSWSTTDGFSDSIFLDLFGFSTIPMFGTDTYFSEAFEMRIFKKSNVRTLKAQFEIFEGAKLYHTLKTKEKTLEEARGQLAYQNGLLEKIEEIKELTPELYSEVIYWKEKDVRNNISELRFKIYGDHSANIDLESFWSGFLFPKLKSKEVILTETGVYFNKSYHQVEKNLLSEGDIAIKARYLEDDENHVCLTLVRMVYGYDGEKLDEEIITEYYASPQTAKKKFHYKLD